jgi:hypothetical protein
MSRLGSNGKPPRDGSRRYFHYIWQPLTLLFITVSFMSTFFTIYNIYASTTYYVDLFFCNADGKLESTDSAYDLWDPNLYFIVNIAFGKLPYSGAKVIDAAWDAVIGRGGQFVAAAVAYRTLRRSFTLTMETCTVTIPAAASLYCRQIQPESFVKLIHTMLWHWGSVHLQLRQAIHVGRVRLCAQLFVCLYVLLFTTLVSVMTGYTALLSGFTGYDDDGTGPLYPINRLVRPRIGLSNGNRVGLSDKAMFSHDAIVYPDAVIDARLEDWLKGTIEFDIEEFLASSRDFKEPWGVLVDCQWYARCLHSRSLS